jgi:hypothetical protein
MECIIHLSSAAHKYVCAECFGGLFSGSRKHKLKRNFKKINSSGIIPSETISEKEKTKTEKEKCIPCFIAKI